MFDLEYFEEEAKKRVKEHETHYQDRKFQEFFNFFNFPQVLGDEKDLDDDGVSRYIFFIILVYDYDHDLDCVVGFEG